MDQYSSIDSNPLSSQIDITNGGTDWLWAVFAIMLAADVGMIALSFMRPVGTRLFHHLSIIILTTAAFAYFSMASDLGSTPVTTEFAHNGHAKGVSRSFWYVRYIDWVITTPLLLLELLLTTGLPLSEILTVVFFDLVMIVAGLVGGLVASSYKWGYFVGGDIALFYIAYMLLVKGPKASLVLGQEVRSAYVRSTGLLIGLWFLYPIAWGFSEGGNVISPTAEMIWYGILDILAKPVFCYLHVFALRGIPYERFALQSGKASYGAGAIGAGAVGGGAGAYAMEKSSGRRSGEPILGSTNANAQRDGALSSGPQATTGAGGGPLSGRTGMFNRANSGRAAAEAQ